VDTPTKKVAFMRIGLFVGALELMRDVAERLNRIAAAERDGFDSYWLPQQFGADMLTIIAMAGMQTSRIELGTAVVPTYPRHPVALAQQALTAQVAVGGRLTLGIGVSHRSTIEDWLGLSYSHPARHIEEYLSVLRPLLHESSVDFDGHDFKVAGELQIPDADMVTCPVILAALGPRMLEIAGRLADGTVTWMTGPNTLRDHVVPRVTAAAEAAGNPPPRVCVGFPIAVTDHPERARARADRLFQHYAALPSYRSILEREGAESPGEIAIVGNEAEVEDRLEALADLGATDLLATIFPVDGSQTSFTRTRTLLQSLVGRI
jgi:F420-dependent oxidoreductase-like protein